MDAESNVLELAFRRSGIPYKVYGGMKFFDRAEIKDMLSYLCVLNNPADDLRLLAAIAETVGLAVENARLFTSEHQRRIFASTLQEVARTINSMTERYSAFA